MKPIIKAILLILLTAAAIALGAIYISSHNIPILEPKGMIGVKERELIITSSLLMLIVVIPVFILTLTFAWKYSEKNEKSTHAPDCEHNNIAECCWWGVPLVIIIILSVITYKSSHELNPFKPIENGKTPIRIQAVALQWKWVFIYPEYGIATVNYIQVPEKTPLSFEITADAPMNSFWVPQLGGQIYAMAAMVSRLHLIADEQGTFEGRSSNFSGTGFAGMKFIVKSTSQEEFDNWVQKVKSSSKQMDFNEFNHLLAPTSYVPPEYYVLTQDDLFDRILRKYSPPSEVK